MPKRKKKRKEPIVVPAVSLRHRDEKLLKDTTADEQRDVFEASAKIGRRLSNLMITVGAVLSLLSVYGILSSAQVFPNLLFLGALGFLGLINIFWGLLLLAKE